MNGLCFGCMQPNSGSARCEHCGYPQEGKNLPHQLPQGALLDRQYLVGRVLGQGGFGITYLGLDQKLNRRIAIKEYFPSGLVSRDAARTSAVTCTTGQEAYRKGLDRFIREAKTLAKLQQVEEISRVHRCFGENGTAYIVMEYVEGTTLEAHIRASGGRLTPAETFRIFRPLLEAMTHIHQAGMIHRDISPDNIMLLKDGRIKLLDFGTARDLDPSAPQATQSTQSVLKYGYAPLEQYQSRGNVGPWTDEYALCATIYFCLTGQLPPEAPARLIDGTPVNWSGIRGLKPRQIQALDKGLAVKVDQRYPDLEALSQDLFRDPDSPGPSRKLLSAILAAGLLGAALLVFLLLPKSPEPAPETPAAANRPTRPAAETTLPPAPEQTQAWEENWLRLPPPTTDYYMNPFVFGNESVLRREVRTVTFLDTLADAPDSAWDASSVQDGRVLGWTDRTGGRLNLYLAAEGGVTVPRICPALFDRFSSLEEVRFNGCFHLQADSDIREMFSGCEQLRSVDMENLDLNGAANLSSLFRDCKKLEAANCSGWDTSQVRFLSNLFRGCTSLTSLDLSGWDTSQVIDMGGMLYGCASLTDLELGHWERDSLRNYVDFLDPGRTYRDQPWETLFHP